MATNGRAPPLPPGTNGIMTGPPRGAVGGNRKKQKRRAKQAAKAAAQGHPLPPGHSADMDYDEDPLGYGEDDDEDSDADADAYNDQYISPHAGTNGMMQPPPPRAGKNKKGKKKTGSAGHSAYDPSMLPPLPTPPPPPPSSSALRTMTKGGHSHGNIWNTSTAQERQNIKDFWLSLSEEERKSLLKIEKEAVLRKMKQQQKHSCSCTVCGRKRTAIEEELEVLYEGYYEELEQYAHHDQPPLLDARAADGSLIPDPLQHRRMPHPLAAPPPMPMNPPHRSSALHEHLDEDEYSDEDEEEASEDEEEEYSDDEDYSDSELPPLEHPSNLPRGAPAGLGVPDFFNFGQNLTVKGILTPWLEQLQQLAPKLNGTSLRADNLLTVADDLLKNDGRKFIEMMEQLAERRMQRETEQAEYAAGGGHQHQGHGRHGGYGGVGGGGMAGMPPPMPGGYNDHEDPLAAGDEYDDEEASYDSQEEYDDEMDEESEMGGLTEEQRMQEGRRMFQIFAARMFEQRVLNAYREKVADERQAKLLEELQDENKKEAEREAKRQRDAQKKKEKKKQQQASKAEEKAKRDAEKAAEEARIREAAEEKAEEQRRRKEEQRKKREEEKRKADEERSRKEAERLRRQQEEQQRREEAERKAREQKAAEKAKKDEQRKREREEREAKEKEARERKALEDSQKKDRDAKSKADKEAKERDKPPQQPAPHPSLHQPQQPPQITKRPSQIGMVAVPGVYPKQTASGISSPHPSIATPAIPKAPTPAKPRQASAQGSHASSPKQAQSQVSSAPSKSSSPASNVPSAPQQQIPSGPKAIMQKQPSGQHMGPTMPQHQHPMQTASPLHPQQGPPGMPPQHHQHPGAFGGMSPMAFPGGFQGPQGPMMHHQRGPMPGMFQPHHGPPMGVPNRGMPFAQQGMNGMGPPPHPPPGMMMSPPLQQQQQQGRGMGIAGFPFDGQVGAPPPGFGQQQQQQGGNQQHTSPIGQPSMHSQMPAPSDGGPRGGGPAAHSRQPSASDKERFESAANQPIARPAPIQRPSSVKPVQRQDRNVSTTDVDDLSMHLGSSALLADDEEPLLPNSMMGGPPGDSRRHSGLMQATNPRNAPVAGGMGGIGGFIGSPAPAFGAPGSQWNTPSLPFGQSSGLGQQNWSSIPNTNANPSSVGMSSAWAHNQGAFAANGVGFGSIGGAGAMHSHRPTGTSMNRPLTIRLAVCQACKQLSNAARGEGDGFHDVGILLRQIEGNRPMLDSPPTLRELEEICETEGDSQNGGGELHVRKSGEEGAAGGGAAGAFAVKWEPDACTPEQGGRGLGEIGSPMPSKTSPSFGLAPGMRGGFQSLGAVGSSSSASGF